MLSLLSDSGMFDIVNWNEIYHWTDFQTGNNDTHENELFFLIT